MHVSRIIPLVSSWLMSPRLPGIARQKVCRLPTMSWFPRSPWYLTLVDTSKEEVIELYFDNSFSWNLQNPTSSPSTRPIPARLFKTLPNVRLSFLGESPRLPRRFLLLRRRRGSRRPSPSSQVACAEERLGWRKWRSTRRKEEERCKGGAGVDRPRETVEVIVVAKFFFSFAGGARVRSGRRREEYKERREEREWVAERDKGRNG